MIFERKNRAEYWIIISRVLYDQYTKKSYMPLTDIWNILGKV